MTVNYIVEQARSNLYEALNLSYEHLPKHSIRWASYAERMRHDINSLESCIDVLHFAQTKVGFEHRKSIHHEGKFTALYEQQLKDEFPQFAALLDLFSDVPDSAYETSYMHLGRPVSNVLFYLSRIILSCITYLPKRPQYILEIGGGYGAPARLWMNNPVHNPSSYFILDVPESLFFSEVVLSSEFGRESVCYVKNTDDFSSISSGDKMFYLIPLPLCHLLTSFEFDLLVNTGSLQEMGEQWVDFYSDFLDSLSVRWFYSLNYFAQPLNQLWESGNLYSPRISSRWTARLLRWNPAFVRMQADRNFLEGIYEKDCTPSNALSDDLVQRFRNRFPSGESFVEIMDMIRHTPNHSNLQLALEFALRMQPIPKEALWLAENITKISGDPTLRVSDQLLSKLRSIRADGVEQYY